MDINSITPIATLITMIAGFIAIIKFLFSLKDEISKLSSKFDRLDERQNATSQRVDKLENKVYEELKEQRTENQKLTNKFVDIIADIPRSAVIA